MGQNKSGVKQYNRVWIIVTALLCALVGGTILYAQTSDFIIHTVTKGESVSLICIDYYGYYSPDLASAIVKDNPEIKNIDLIYAGQKIKFHPPVTSAPAKAAHTQPSRTTSPQQAPDTLFVKKLDATQGVVTDVEGEVLLYKKGSSKGEALTVNTLVYPGDTIVTSAKGRVELIVNRESVVRLKENTRAAIDSFRDKENNKGKTKFGFDAGSIWTKVKKFKDAVSRFELELPTAIAGVHGTVYQSTVNTDSSCEVKVYSGEVSVAGGTPKTQAGSSSASEVKGPEEVPGPEEVDMGTWTRIVRSMQKISISKKGKPSDPSTFAADSASNWERWNVERDRRIAEMFMEVSYSHD